MRNFRREVLIFALVFAVIIVPSGVLAQEVSTLYRIVGVGVSDARLFVLRIFQILWGLISAGSLGVLIFGLVRMRSSYEDVVRFENAKRIVLFSAISLVTSLIIVGLISFFYWRISAQYRVGTSVVETEAPAQAGFSELRGPFSKIEQHYPLRDERDVARNVSVVVTLRDVVRPSSAIDERGLLRSDAIELRELTLEDDEVGEPLEATATVMDDGKTLKIDPVELLGRENVNSTKYRVVLTSVLLDEQGNSIFGETGSYSWVFFVGEQVDTEPPQVESVFPAIGKGAVARNALVQITFTKPIDPSSFVGGNIELYERRRNALVEGSFSLHNNYKTLLFTPSETCATNMCDQKMYCLEGGASYRVIVKAASLKDSRSNTAALPFDGIVDLSGNSFDGGGVNGAQKDGVSQGAPADNFEWLFTTTPSLDLSVPRILSMSPGRSGVRLELDAPIEVVFSRPMDMSSLHSSSLSLDGGINFWVTSLFDGEQGRTISYIYHDPFSPDTIYSPRVQSTVRDAYQNCYASCIGPVE